jgi:MFS family permease
VLGRALDSLLDERESPEVRRDVTTLTVARLFANSFYLFAPPFLAVIARGVGVSLDQIGIALAIAELSGLLSPLTARLVDHLPRRSAMGLGLVGVVLGTVLAASSVGLAMFTVALVILSQSKVLFDLGLGSWIADHVPYERRGAVVGLTETSWALALLVGVSTMGLATAVSSWRVGYLTGAASVLLMAAIVVRQLPREAKVTMHRTHAEGEKRPALALGARTKELETLLAERSVEYDRLDQETHKLEKNLSEALQKHIAQQFRNGLKKHHLSPASPYGGCEKLRVFFFFS